ncbi:salicylate hydroxylase [Cryptococcus neoformans]|nr:salicylate hydroxylase [Cryptococcus neoformans var. grubii Th84]OXH18130.1 salicylate hydroxylase [Cryptococcus neoformans var. grubii]OXH37962.1 salicylate hydroxylase [Cryptococcus neoformans var. grubii]OXH58674.1 salicylate hydroxylase [Cryptococcus neoformans var. grubii]OXH59143.1 salicylate hydroxylase [Cryptococcus neoformans var. grubii]
MLFDRRVLPFAWSVTPCIICCWYKYRGRQERCLSLSQFIKLRLYSLPITKQALIMAPILADDLRIHIIGAGMGGMGSALALAKQGYTNIHVWESAREIGEVGAGINITPNLSRILDGWGVLDIARAEAVALDGASVLRCAEDDVLTSVDFKYIEKEFGYPFYVVHRSALQKCLVTGAMDSGVVKLHLGKLIKEWDFDNNRFFVTSRDQANGTANGNGSTGEWVEGDVILASDGVKSKARGAMLKRKGEEDHVEDTGQAAYRIIVKRSMINEDPELLPFFTGSHSYRWIGEKRHIIAYPIASHELFNMSTAHPDRRFVEADSWTASGSKEEMLDMFHDFCPRVQKLLRTVSEESVLEWKLRVHTPLSHWVDGNTALVGDACHPTLPHLAQGAAQAVEDAAVLGVVLSKIKSKEEIHKALLVYQALRKPRADWAVLTAAANGKGLHLGAGKDQEARDAAFRQAKKEGGENPDKAIDQLTQKILYAHDCAKEAEERYAELLAEVA